MPRRKQNQLLLLRVFIVAFGLLVLLAGGLYYRRQALNQEQLREAQEAKQAALQSKEKFIKVVAPLAQKADKPYGLYPSVTIAQACLESNYGQSSLAKLYNNLFGVKGTDPNTSKVMTTSEYVNGHWKTISGRFQIYDSYQAAIQAHARLLAQGTTWNPNQYQHVLQAKDWRSQAKALCQDGYATDPNYPSKLISLVEQFNLTKYD
ncbi:MAG: glycoside hydrolase family 73 protein [Lactobacillus sp.]|jgi:flagellum-specific peptidoglycan hydrolase FlgJ|nr:glycoside hydrolase family 73 protein [Lactobacillus sp.]